MAVLIPKLVGQNQRTGFSKMLVEDMFLLLVVGLARLWHLVGVRMTDLIEEDMEVGVDQTEVVLEAEVD